jgi:hypothetical protein
MAAVLPLATSAVTWSWPVWMTCVMPGLPESVHF